ncbi:MAG TPA: alpha/beta fold hydrolase [Acidimicrobiales bacterium]|nr:alpha/beta fold hydrolase [Acidimicrobiales bacterium]
MDRLTYVLVHGAWHGAWCWRDVTAELDRRGVAWRTLDLPSGRDTGAGSSDLADDASAVATAAEGSGPVVLVGHSYAGAVIAEAAANVDELSSLVFIAALIPGLGQSANDASRELRVRTSLDEAIVVDGPLLRIDPERASEAFYGDCSPSDQEWAIAHLGTQTLASFLSARQTPDPSVPRRYILCDRDRAIDPALQELMSQRCDDILRLTSDHSPFISHAEECVNAIVG